MKHIHTFENFLNEANAFNNFSTPEKKAWKKNENRLGKTYFVPKNEEEYKRMMEFLADKNWSFWNAFGIEGYTTEKIDASSLPTWKAGIGFELGGTQNGSTQIIPTKMTPTTQGAEFDLKTFQQFLYEGKDVQKLNESYSSSDIKKLEEFAEELSDEIRDNEPLNYRDYEDFSPENFFEYITGEGYGTSRSKFGEDKNLKTAADVIKKYNSIIRPLTVKKLKKEMGL